MLLKIASAFVMIFFKKFTEWEAGYHRDHNHCEHHDLFFSCIVYTSPGLYMVFKFRVVLLLNGLPTKPEESSLLYYLTHSLMGKGKFIYFPKGICLKVNVMKFDWNVNSALWFFILCCHSLHHPHIQCMYYQIIFFVFFH